MSSTYKSVNPEDENPQDEVSNWEAVKSLPNNTQKIAPGDVLLKNVHDLHLEDWQNYIPNPEETKAIAKAFLKFTPTAAEISTCINLTTFVTKLRDVRKFDHDLHTVNRLLLVTAVKGLSSLSERIHISMSHPNFPDA